MNFVNPCWLVAGLLALVGPVASWGDSMTVSVDSRAFGTVNVGWDAAWAGPDQWTWGAGAQASLPLFLTLRGGGIDTGAFEARGRAEWDSGLGWFSRGRGTTGVSTQTEVRGTFTSWTAKLALEPGFRAGWGELWLVIQPEAALVTLVRPSAYTSATFADRYEDDPASPPGGAVVLGLSAFRLLAGMGTEVNLAPGLSVDLTVGVYPPLRADWVGWMDGFSFGEIPFFSSLGGRFRL